MDATHECWMEKINQRGKASTACETDHGKEKADVQSTTEHGKWMEESSRSAVQHADEWLDNLQREGMLGLSRVINLEDRVVAGSFTSIK